MKKTLATLIILSGLLIQPSISNAENVSTVDSTTSDSLETIEQSTSDDEASLLPPSEINSSNTTTSEATEAQSDAETVQSVPRLLYRTHIRNLDWQNYVEAPNVSGSTGKAQSLDGISIKLEGEENIGGISYQTHIKNVGWQGWKNNDEVSGITDQSLHLEAIKLKLTGIVSEKYDVFYRVHAQNFGWLGWAKNGEEAGSQGFSRSLEAIEIRLIKKGEQAPVSSKKPFEKLEGIPTINYQTHVQNIGWQKPVADGMIAGTTGRSLRLEGLKVNISHPSLEGNIQYSTHVQNIGWQHAVSNGQASGTTGRSLRLEGVQIKLTGPLANYYDIYYRTHVQNIGWLDWAKNGVSSGSEGFGYRLEGIQVRIIKKGAVPPKGNNLSPFYNNNESILLGAPFISQYAANAPMGCEAASLLQGLHYKKKATNYNLKTFLKEMPVSSNGNPHNGFGGTPYRIVSGTYQSIFPAPLAAWGQRYGSVTNFSGATIYQIRDQIKAKNPLVVYIVMDWKNPIYSNYFWGRGMDNMHVVLLDGYRKGAYHIVDPAKGSYWINSNTFERSINYLRYAAVIK